MAKPKTETITDTICGWPYYQPYVFLQKIPRKKRIAKSAGGAPKKIRKARKPRITPSNSTE